MKSAFICALLLASCSALSQQKARHTADTAIQEARGASELALAECHDLASLREQSAKFDAFCRETEKHAGALRVLDKVEGLIAASTGEAGAGGAK